MIRSKHPNDVDVLILGAGPAGSALAIALKRAGVGDVLLVDQLSRKSSPIGEAAAPGLGPLLCQLGLDDRLETRGHRPCYGNRSLWGRAKASVEDFMRRAKGPGWHLDRAAFDSWLREEAVKAGARFLPAARLEAAERQKELWRADMRTADGPSAIRPRWIVDSTGRPAAFARRSGARLRRFDRLIGYAMLATPSADAGFAGYSLIEAAEFGWWYAARLPGRRAVVALMTDSDIARSAGFVSAGEFRRAWAKSSEISRFAVPPDDGRDPAAFAAGTQFIDQAIAPGWLALGDALMAFDPLCAAGITGALEDALAAADTIVPLLEETNETAARSLRDNYARRADRGLQHYMAEHRAVYGAEGRWRQSSFWARRQTARPASIPS